MIRVLVPIMFMAGCALVQPPPKAEAPLGPAEVRSAHAAADGLEIGRSRKGDVRAALGEAVVVDFESGYEVWVYRERLAEKAAPPATELVLLFAPTGILTKARVR